MRLHVPTYLLLLAVTCSISVGAEMQSTQSTNRTNSTTSNPSATQSLTTTITTANIISAGNMLASGSGSGSGSGSQGNWSSTSALTCGSLSAGGNVLLLFTVSIFFSLALLMK